MSKNLRCEHGDLYSCSLCGGKGRCAHGRMRQNCRECKAQGTGGSSICEHDRVRSTCVACGGGSICKHRRVKTSCAECSSRACEHGRIKSNCKKCAGFIRLARTMYQSAKKRAAKKGIPFDLTVQDIFELIGNGVCPVFGTPFEMEPGLSKQSASLDRFKPELGYTRANCSVISYLANAMKQGATSDEIQRLADWVRSRE